MVEYKHPDHPISYPYRDRFYKKLNEGENGRVAPSDRFRKELINEHFGVYLNKARSNIARQRVVSKIMEEAEDCGIEVSEITVGFVREAVAFENSLLDIIKLIRKKCWQKAIELRKPIQGTVDFKSANGGFEAMLKTQISERIELGQPDRAKELVKWFGDNIDFVDIKEKFPEVNFE